MVAEGPPLAAFETLCGGALPERLEHELQQVFDNIADENTDPKKTRELHVVFKFKPNANRDAGAVDVEMKKKLAPMSSANGVVYFRIGAGGEQIAIVNEPPEQGQLKYGEAPAKPPLKAVAANG